MQKWHVVRKRTAGGKTPAHEAGKAKRKKNKSARLWNFRHSKRSFTERCRRGG